MTTVMLALRDYGKNPWFIAAFYIQLVIAGFFFALCFTFLSWDLQQIRYIDRTKGMVSFNSYYRTDNTLMMIPEPVQKALLREIDGTGRAFTYTLSGSLDAYPDVPVYLSIGSAEKLFLEEGLGGVENRGYAHIGSAVEGIEVGDLLQFGRISTLEVPVLDRLAGGTRLFHRSMNFLLDDGVVIHLSYGQVIELFGNSYGEELIQNLIYLEDSTEEIHAYVDTVNSSGFMQVIPHDNWSHHFEFNYNNLKADAFFSIFFLLFLLFSLLGILLYLLHLLDRNRKEYAVHQMVGATMGSQLMRLFVLLLFILAPPALFVVLLIGVLQLDFMIGAGAYCTIVASMFVICMLTMAIKLRKGLLDALRSDYLV